MTIPEIEVTDGERDALAEIVNMGVSRAATSLRQLLHEEEVLLSVPMVDIVKREAAARLVGEAHAPQLVAVQQSFEGPFSGKALLIFLEAHSLELVRSIVGETYSLDDIMDMEQEALAETGNIILNGCLAAIANVLRRKMRMSLPSVIRGDGAMLFDLEHGASTDSVLFLYIDFTIRNRNIRGFVAMLLDLPATTALKKIVRDFIADLERQVAGDVR